ncbi:MAG: bifunctional UDP-N-acetylglucosamine diphosphorylase/glucosamine-1-phosphate N-acetyltransferase GlmU [Vicinamibacterales bacterium]
MGSSLHVVVLAAGQGTRMKSARPKVLHAIAGRSLLDWVLTTAESLEPRSISVVVGHKAELVGAAVRARGHHVAIQAEQLGTAHALRQAEAGLAGECGTLLLLSGDVPLLNEHDLRSLLQAHETAGAAATVLTAEVEHPFGYGRIVRTDGAISAIVEERDASPAQREIREINSGIYAFEMPLVWQGLGEIAANNNQGEYYLPDLVKIYRRRGLAVATATAAEAASIQGINSRSELAEAGGVMRQRKNEELMAAGVTIVDPASTYVDAGVSVGADTVLHPGVVLEGTTHIGQACEIHAYVRMRNMTVGDRVTVNNFCVLTDSTVGDEATVGPFAHIRPGSAIGSHGKVGNFVELKKTTLGEGSKVNHLSYVGDAQVGAHVNVGAGTITCNFDGTHKHQTVIGDGAFIGSGTQLVAPVTVGAGAYVAAGSAITEDVPPAGLGVARERQRNIEGWANRRPRKD